MQEHAIRSLAAATILQAVKDYFRGNPKSRQQILKDLRSNWMDSFTNGMSVIVADKLERNPEEIARRMKEDGRCAIV